MQTSVISPPCSNSMHQSISIYRQVLLNVAFRILSDSELAEDVVHDVFLTYLQAPDNFNGASTLKTYLYRMVINRCIDVRRRRSRFSRLLENFNWENHGYPQNTYEAKDLTRRVLSDINDQFRIPLILTEVDGMSYEEIASTLNLTVNTVRTRIFRCRQKLRKKLKSLGYPL